MKEISFNFFMNKNIRTELINLVIKYKIIILKNLNNFQRHEIYRQMYYPLTFQKKILNKNIIFIKIFFQ